MKYKVTAEEFEQLDEGAQVNYKKKGDDYQLIIEGMPDYENINTTLQSRLDALDSKNTEFLDEIKKLKQERENQHRDSGDVEALEKSWQDKYDTLQNEKQGTISELTGALEKLTTGATADRIASQIAVQGSAAALTPHLRQRLKTDMVNGVPKTVVLDAEGRPSALTVDELANEFKANPIFKPLIVGTKANGAGHQSQSGHAGGAGAKTLTRADFASLSVEQRHQHIKDGGTLVDN